MSVKESKPDQNSLWNEPGYAKDPTQIWHQDGWCENLQVFKGQWDKFPSAPCEIFVRNFNKIAGNITIEIKTPGTGIGWDRLYYHRANLANFFPEDIMAFLEQEEKSSGRLSAPFLIKIGDLIANALGREFWITHQEGGDQTDADFTDYGPFLPNQFRSFDFVPKRIFVALGPEGFLELDLFGEEQE